MIQYPLFIIVTLAAVTVLVIRHVARGNAQRIRELADLEGKTTAVDLRAFRNLMDPGQREFLRRSLARRDYRRLQRLRISVASSYVKTVYANAAILIRLGEALQLNPATVEDGARVVDLALRNRISAVLLLVKLRIVWIIPDLELSTESLMDNYSHLTDRVGSILRNTLPVKGSRIMAAL